MRRLVCIAALCASTNAVADSNEEFLWATQIATIIATADTCGYSLSKEKVDALIASRISKLDTMAKSNFYNYLTLGGDIVDRMTPTAKNAQCSLNAESAKLEGITP